MSGWRDNWRRVRAVAWKDLTTERRSKAGFNGVVALGVTILMLFAFALGPDTGALREAAAGALWLAVLFAGVLTFNRSYQVELETGALEQLLLYPGSRWTIFTGKLLANLTFVALMLAIVVLVGIVLFQVSVPPAWPAIIGVLALGTLGIVTLGTFYAAMASRSRAREVLLPLLLFPMLIPALLAAMQASKALLSGDIMNEAGAWMGMLVAYDIIFLVATHLAFEHVIEA
ncbi:MAG TPA: heme exporter protein CcmB [Gemmatimonadaceae bacterium]|nr:heme exporter protein CcmB [Gemmatimonadaceae bacterium]